MSTYILSFDPGKSSGIAYGKVGVGTPYELIERWQFSGGLSGLLGWMDRYPDVFDYPLCPPADEDDHVIISEKFVPLQGKGFAQTLDSTEPLRCEGALVARYYMPDYPDPRWRRPAEMYLYGGSDLTEKKKRARMFLKDHGILTTGKNVGQPDGDDANSAIWHGISYAARVLKHRPTFEWIADWSREVGNGGS